MTLRLRLTLLCTALAVALLLAVRVLLHAGERERSRLAVEQTTAHLLARHFPPRPPRSGVGVRPEPEHVADLPDGASAVLLYAPVGAPSYVHLLHTGSTPALADLDREPVPAPPDRGPAVREARRADRDWRVRVELVARPKPSIGPDGRPLGPPPGERRPSAPDERLASPPDGPPAREPRGDGPRGPSGSPAAVLVGVLWFDLSPSQAALAARLVELDRTLLFLLVPAAVLAWLAAGLMLRPLQRAARAAETVTSVAQRLPAPTAKDELGRLITVLNAMLARLDAGARRERTFLATAGHELRRPLTALTGELELALRGPQEVRNLSQALMLALGDARAMGRLVQDLLDHARAEAGSLTLERGEVDLLDVLEEAVQRSRRAVGGVLDVTVEPSPPVVVEADRAALGRVFENLLTNAATHGGEGVAVRVRLGVEPGLAVVDIDDDGPGIPAATLATLFEPFARADEARTHPGTGLGLSIARTLARAHGGDVTATSPAPGVSGPAAGPGTRFTVRLPMTPAPGALAQPRA